MMSIYHLSISIVNLKYFQDHPEYLRDFYTLYIEYFKERKEWVIAHCKSNFQKYREHYEDTICPSPCRFGFNNDSLV